MKAKSRCPKNYARRDEPSDERTEDPRKANLKEERPSGDKAGGPSRRFKDAHAHIPTCRPRPARNGSRLDCPDPRPPRKLTQRQRRRPTRTARKPQLRGQTASRSASSARSARSARGPQAQGAHERREKVIATLDRRCGSAAAAWKKAGTPAGCALVVLGESSCRASRRPRRRRHRRLAGPGVASMARIQRLEQAPAIAEVRPRAQVSAQNCACLQPSRRRVVAAAPPSRPRLSDSQPGQPHTHAGAPCHPSTVPTRSPRGRSGARQATLALHPRRRDAPRADGTRLCVADRTRDAA